MNKGVSPVGINNSIGFKATKVKPSNIDIAYEKELIAIRKRKQALDVFEKINPESKMEKIKNKIQITIDNMFGKRN